MTTGMTAGVSNARRFDGRIAVVTGAARGIGAGISERLAADGAHVLVTDKSVEDAETAAMAIRAQGGSAIAAAVDVRSKESVEDVPQLAKDAFGGAPHVIVSNAGVQTFAPAVETTERDWDDVLDVNARGVMFVLQMAAGCLPEGGSVVNIASIQGRLGNPYYPHYSASKAAVLSLTRSFALALAPQKIRVNAVAPGVIDTPLWAKADAAISKIKGIEPGSAMVERIEAVPLKRAGTPADIAAAVAFLASDDASYITGETIHVCGGDVML